MTCRLTGGLSPLWAQKLRVQSGRCVCVYMCVLAGIPRGLCACMRGGVCTDVCAHVCVPSVRRKEREREIV